MLTMQHYITAEMRVEGGEPSVLDKVVLSTRPSVLDKVVLSTRPSVVNKVVL